MISAYKAPSNARVVRPYLVATHSAACSSVTTSRSAHCSVFRRRRHNRRSEPINSVRMSLEFARCCASCQLCDGGGGDGQSFNEATADWNVSSDGFPVCPASDHDYAHWFAVT